MIVAIRTMNSMFLNGNRNRANPYATTMPDETAPIVLSTAIAAVLNRSRGKSSCDQAVVKLAISRREGPRLGQRPPVTLPHDRRRGRVTRVDEGALFAAPRDQHQAPVVPSIGTS